MFFLIFQTLNNLSCLCVDIALVSFLNMINFRENKIHDQASNRFTQVTSNISDYNSNVPQRTLQDTQFQNEIRLTNFKLRSSSKKSKNSNSSVIK